MTIPIREIVRRSRDPEFLRAMEAEFDRLDQEATSHRPTCVNRGDCCNFGAFGHRLFVTSAELAVFLAKTEGPIRSAVGPGVCPYQIEGLCTAREGRPGGCRVFFCDPTAAHWQPDATERFLARVRALHERFDLPYVYVEWLEALRQLSEV